MPKEKKRLTMKAVKHGDTTSIEMPEELTRMFESPKFEMPKIPEPPIFDPANFIDKDNIVAQLREILKGLPISLCIAATNQIEQEISSYPGSPYAFIPARPHRAPRYRYCSTGYNPSPTICGS